MAPKAPVDHSAISAPKVPPQEGKKSDFLTAMQKTMQSTPTVPAQTGSTPAPSAPAKPAVDPLAAIRTGKQPKPPRILMVGTEGIGKSTFAAGAPNTIFVPTEDGLNEIDCSKWSWTENGQERYKAHSYDEVKDALTAIATRPHEFNTVAVDSVDWLEQLIWEHVCRRFGKKNIEDIGYAKGYIHALDEWHEIVDILEACRTRGMACILIAHAKVEKFEDPENPTYDRYSPRLNKHAQAFVTEWVDAVLFATRKTTIKRENPKDADSRAMAVGIGENGGQRIIRTTGSPACVAKNRYNLPPEIPLSWDAFSDGLAKFMTGAA